MCFKLHNSGRIYYSVKPIILLFIIINYYNNLKIKITALSIEKKTILSSVI